MANTIKSNGARFLEAYNAIDRALRIQYNFKPVISFTDLIRQSANLNHIVRTYEVDLIEFARLRNAIVHGGDVGTVIAEPHTDVVDLLEKIQRLLTTPPLVAEVIKVSNVVIFDATKKMKDLITNEICCKYGTIPAYKGENLIGVVRWREFVEDLGNCITSGRSLDNFVQQTSVEEYIRTFPQSGLFVVVSRKATIEECISQFNRNKKLSCIIVTSNGTNSERPIGILTNSNILDLVKILEKY
ncbi:MAG: CBS domain-containing protein [Christensenellaceae bacterium]|jgi:predicted transcriptional regulator|nr:CBS domain-containing protein [Christensenellaceae bacterium]